MGFQFFAKHMVGEVRDLPSPGRTILKTTQKFRLYETGEFISSTLAGDQADDANYCVLRFVLFVLILLRTRYIYCTLEICLTLLIFNLMS